MVCALVREIVLSIDRENCEEPISSSGNNMEPVIGVARGGLELFVVDRYQSLLLEAIKVRHT